MMRRGRLQDKILDSLDSWLLMDSIINNAALKMMLLMFLYSAAIAEERIVTATKGSDVVLQCLLGISSVQPEWQGPPNNTLYSKPGNPSLNIRVPSILENRTHWNKNNIDLNIRAVQKKDEGTYLCNYGGNDVDSMTLVVTDNFIYDCGAYPNISYGTAHGNGTMTVGMNAYVACITGFNASTSTITCQENGTWSSAICVLIDCGALPNITYGTAHGNGTTIIGVNASVNCIDGYSASSSTITCQEDGIWSTAICVPKVTYDSSHIGAVVGVVVLSIFLLIVCVVLGCIFRKRCLRQKMLQQDLIEYYREVFSRPVVSPFCGENKVVDFLEFYVKPPLTILSDQGSKGRHQSITVKSCHDIFVKDFKSCHNIYISSPAGCGKTSLTRWLALTWCQAHQPIAAYNNGFNAEDVDEMRKFTFLFIIVLRDECRQECDVDSMIQNQLLSSLAHNTTYTDLGLKFLQKLLSSVKCIIILDGLDEWSHPHGYRCELHNKETPYIRSRPLCTTLTTSRPWKLAVVGLKPGEIDQKLELNGLDSNSLRRLNYNVVTKLNKLHGKDMQANDFEDDMKDKKFTALSKVPLVVMQQLTVWCANEKLGNSQCKIYTNMIKFLLLEHCSKERDNVSAIENIEVDDCSSKRQTPECLQKKMCCKGHGELLSKLAKLAYNTLFIDNELSLVFDRIIVKKYLTDQEIKTSLAVGILMSDRQSRISFLHKTFQEYLAALHVALSSNVEEQIKCFCCSIEKILEMSHMFMFLSGLCPQVMVNLHEHLRETVSEDSWTQRYRASCEQGLLMWPSEGHTLQQIQDTMEKWLGECWLNGHKNDTHLPVSDCFIDWPSIILDHFDTSNWSAELKYLIDHNHVYSLYVFGDGVLSFCNPKKTEDILNSVTVFKCIQKLWLDVVSETFVDQLVCQHKCSLRVSPETWRHLECVTLHAVSSGMSGDILYSLADSILPLARSVMVRLENYDIRQRNLDWRKHIWSLPELTVDYNNCKMSSFSVDCNDGMMSYFYLLQFHTNKV